MNTVPAYQTASCFTSDGLQWAWDSHSIRTAKECLEKYRLSILIGLRSTAEAAPLTWGILYHKGREQYYRERWRGLDHEEALRSAVRLVLVESSVWDEQNKRWVPWFSLDRSRNIITLLRTLILRLDGVQTELDMAPTLEINGKPAIEQRFRFEIDRQATAGQNYVICGYLDRMLARGDSIEIEDYKHTTGQISSEIFHAKFDQDPQMSTYILAGQVAFHQPVDIVTVDWAQVQIQDSKFIRQPVSRTDEYLDEWLTELQWLLDEVEMAHQTGRWRHNDTACRFCQFRDICRRPPSERSSFLSRFHLSVWNPLETREQ